MAYIDPFKSSSQDKVRLFRELGKKEESQTYATMTRDAFLTLFRCDVALYRKLLATATETHERLRKSWDALQSKITCKCELEKRILQAEYSEQVKAEIEAYLNEPRSWWRRLWMVKEPNKIRSIAHERLRARGVYEPEFEVMMLRGPSYLIPKDMPRPSRYEALEAMVRDQLTRDWYNEHPEGKGCLEYFGYFPVNLEMRDAQWEALGQLVDELDSRMLRGQLAFQMLNQNVGSVDNVSIPTYLLNPPDVKKLYVAWIPTEESTTSAP